MKLISYNIKFAYNLILINILLTYNGLSEAPILERGQSKIPDFDAARRAGNEDVVAFQISVNVQCTDSFFCF